MVSPGQTGADDRRAWQAAATVPDPEIPCVNMADLGILRRVSVEGATATAYVTPTYSGCPAVLAIELAIASALREAGFSPRIRRVMAPPWTTDWITDEGREKLRAYGIAPPAGTAGKSALFDQTPVVCPRCASDQTTRIAEFGSTACKALYRCECCHETFDYFKCI